MYCMCTVCCALLKRVLPVGFPEVGRFDHVHDCYEIVCEY